MTIVRNVWTDLVEKRLWPLAAALAIALVAGPIVLARGGGAPPAPAPLPPLPQTAAAGGASAAPAQPIRVVDPTPTAAPHGRYHDPFAGAAKKDVSPAAPAPAPAPSPAAASAPATPSTAAAPSTPAPPATHPVSPAPVKPAAPAPTGYAAGYRLDVGFGEAGDVKTSRDVVRLKTLQAGATPLAIYLGVRADGKTAMFLLDAPSTPTGDGTCWPSRAACQIIELRRGDSEFFDVPQGDAGVVQYELDVNRVAERRNPSHAAAVRLRTRQSKAGRRAMFAVIKSGRTYVSRLVYASVRGVIVVRHGTTLAGAPVR